MNGDDQDAPEEMQVWRAPYHARSWGDAAPPRARPQAWDGVSLNFGAIAFLGVLGLIGLGLVLYFRRPLAPVRSLTGLTGPDARRLLEEGFV